MKLYIFLLILFTLSGCSSAQKGPTFDGKLLGACPDSPNCVSSTESSEKHYADPITYSVSREKAHTIILDILSAEKHSEIVTDTPEYIHVIFRSPFFRFKDDLELYLPEGESVIHFRSAARMGYSDFGVNRKRLERIRNSFTEAEGKI